MMFEAPLAHNLLQLRSVCHQMYCLCLPCPTSCGLHPRSNASKLSNSAFTKKVYCVPQGQGALLGTYAGLANQFVTSHAAMRQMQETLVQEQNLFISLLGAVWRRVRPFVKRNNTSEGSRNPHREIKALTCHTLHMSVDYQLFSIPKCVL